ncbi:MAG: ATP-binding cassette domain-containing protein [Actinomycetota bacterium]|nr:ATP-binding cassette domain-containing protein [Actinomycetota bacterium]
MIDVRGLHKAFGDRVLFRDASLRIGARDRVALVGPNGSGKTTLVEMIAGIQQPDGGEITVPKDAVIGYLPQETDALRGKTALAEVLSAGQAMTEAGHRLDVLQRELAETTDTAERGRLLTEFGHLQSRFETLGGYSLEAEASRICAGLGFRERDLGRMIEELSGGWMMRVALAKLLVANPDCLLLDEPTNHLDLESVVWLEGFLAAYEGAVVLISHDRDVMNGVATRVVEVEGRTLTSYTGNFEAFVEQRELRREQAEAAARNQGRKIAQTERFIERFRYKNTKARQVQSRIKQLEKLERVEVPSRKRRALKLWFPSPPRPGRVVVELAGVDFSYGDVEVYRDLSVAIERGQRVALVGPNGAGKSTLLKLVAGALDPKAGERRLGANALVGYFAQHQIEALDPRNRVLEELERAIPAGAQVNARDLLGRFLFSGDDVKKPVAVLSGGERTRLALARLLVQPYNLLCLDEPTNHLDIPSRDALEEALQAYEGALVLITHDRHLIRTVADRILEVEAGLVTSYEGDYELYRYRKEREASPGAAEPTAGVRPAPGVRPPVPLDGKSRRQATALERARLQEHLTAVRRVERDLDRETAEFRRLEERLADPGFYKTGGDDVATAVRRHGETRERIASLEERWERATEELSALEGSG